MAWCRLAKSHYLIQWWSSSVTAYKVKVTRPQWVQAKALIHFPRKFELRLVCIDPLILSVPVLSGETVMYWWWRLQMETFIVLLALCARNLPVTGEFPSKRPVTRSFDVFFDLSLNKQLSKHSRRWWFETLLCSLWRKCNGSYWCYQYGGGQFYQLG